MLAIQWQWAAFHELDGIDVHAMLRVRQDVFVLEQQCIYADIDDADPQAHHLLGWSGEGDGRQLLAYLRCFSPGEPHSAVTLGRILTVQSVRGMGVGKQLLLEALRRVEQYYPGHRIRLSAQEHLQGFYGCFGFLPVSAVYLEDGIPHIEMLR